MSTDRFGPHETGRARRPAVRTAALAIALLATTAAGAATPPQVAAFLRDRDITWYRLAQSDLNGDGRPEALVYASDTAGGGDADLCGTGGCNLYVLEITAAGYRPITAMTISRPPIRVLPEISNGWHDLSVFVAGGGIRGHEARLRFDGKSYPTNPSMATDGQVTETSGEAAIDRLPLDTVRAVRQVIEHLDLTSFRNSTSPRREPDRRSFADYGFTIVEQTEDGANLYRAEGGWMTSFRLLGSDPTTLRICFGDRGLIQPADVYGPSYDARSALAITISSERWWKAIEVPDGFETCESDPPITG